MPIVKTRLERRAVCLSSRIAFCINVGFFDAKRFAFRTGYVDSPNPRREEWRQPTTARPPDLWASERVSGRRRVRYFSFFFLLFSIFCLSDCRFSRRNLVVTVQLRRFGETRLPDRRLSAESSELMDRPAPFSAEFFRPNGRMVALFFFFSLVHQSPFGLGVGFFVVLVNCFPPAAFARDGVIFVSSPHSTFRGPQVITPRRRRRRRRRSRKRGPRSLPY